MRLLKLKKIEAKENKMQTRNQTFVEEVAREKSTKVNHLKGGKIGKVLRYDESLAKIMLLIQRCSNQDA